MRRTALAPAKVNLFLHVGPLAADGYHPIASLMSFADVGDTLALEQAQESGLQIVGPFAAGLAGEDPAANLAWRAAQRLLQHAGLRPNPFRIILDKQLPVAAGLGGGSSDAGAALRLVRDAFAPDAGDDVLTTIAAELGADGPACLFARPMLAQGRGDRLSPAPELPPLPAVLVNPGVTCSTGRVYRVYDEQAELGRADLPDLPAAFRDVSDVVGALAACRNDLEPPALHVAPDIADVLQRLRLSPQVGLARLSGSGATCFGLCATSADARALAAQLEAEQPGWWVRACTLGGAGEDEA